MQIAMTSLLLTTWRCSDRRDMCLIARLVRIWYDYKKIFVNHYEKLPLQIYGDFFFSHEN